MKTLSERNKLKAEFRSWKEELALWQEHKPSFRHNNPADYQKLLATWNKTADGIRDMMRSCIAEARS